MSGNIKSGNIKACPRCRSDMVQVAEAPAINGSLGLIAWLCQRCGATDSDLIYPRSSKRAG
jgi:hypothetical protein